MKQTQVVELTADNFKEEVLNAHKPTLVDFWAPWCGPCLAMSPLVEATAQAFSKDLKVGKVNVDRNSGLAAQYRIFSIPTLTLFSKGKAVKTWVGTQSQQGFGRELADELRREIGTPIVHEMEQLALLLQDAKR